ncbi:hypothetical protein BT63DRAFT_452261 [Microthyrium microscopicum]|uniref:Zn(2)-C6 fungal-type domain-containing protein n=1 Tax=Microthyrium microscopicum TaxID=703497 RepID=A0A6A6UHK2_9PEZI|nr:hypothetical protein BT63DRAFT_452261 [Microthyrium microscopicum]
MESGFQANSDTHGKTPAKPARRGKRKEPSGEEASKRRCVSTACIACRRRKSKCDGNLPACAACSSVYYTECVYDPNSDHRRKGVYRKDEKLKPRNTTLEVLMQALLNGTEDKAFDLLRQIRACESLDAVAEGILAKGDEDDEDEEVLAEMDESALVSPTFETHLSNKMGALQVEGGSARYIGGTSNLLFLSDPDRDFSTTSTEPSMDPYFEDDEDPITSWTTITKDPTLIKHLLKMYFTWHYPYFTTLSRNLFLRDFHRGRLSVANDRRKLEYCTPLLVNAMLALGCHFTGWPDAREDREDSATAGNHFFKEAKRLFMINDEYEKAKLPTVQALALMSVREAGCGREAKGWVYSGMSFRMACDLGLNLDSGLIPGARESGLDEEEVDARRMTFWGCFLFDKCWSNYLGRLPQLPMSIVTVPKFDVFPDEDSQIWAAYTDSGSNQAHAQPARTRAVALHISALCEISGDLMTEFYNPIDIDKAKVKQSELKKLSEIHQRLESWRRNLPVEMEPKEGGLPNMLVMHMFFQLLYIHLFRPFLKYNQATSPLPPNVSPRRLCTQAATAISKLLRLYKRSHGLRQICNVAVYIAHSACTIHLLNLPDKNAKRDITHGVKHLEEIAESWLCARRTLAILSVLSRQWSVQLPDEAAAVLARTDTKFAAWNRDITARYPSSKPSLSNTMSPSPAHQVLVPNPNIFASASQRTSPNFRPLPTSPESLPPQNAAELLRGHPSTTNSTPQAQVSPYSSDSRGSLDITSGHSPSAVLGAGVDQLLRSDGNEWWMKDQNQLAAGFAQWSAADDSMWRTGSVGGGIVGAGVTSPNMPTTMGLDEAGLARLFAMNGGSAGMGYPNESEWYM